MARTSRQAPWPLRACDHALCLCLQVNIDFQTREATRKNMQEPSLTCFDQAQGKVHSLMEKDSYPRFLRSKMYLDLLSQSQRRLS